MSSRRRQVSGGAEFGRKGRKEAEWEHQTSYNGKVGDRGGEATTKYTKYANGGANLAGGTRQCAVLQIIVDNKQGKIGSDERENLDARGKLINLLAGVIPRMPTVFLSRWRGPIIPSPRDFCGRRLRASANSGQRMGQTVLEFLGAA
jgi:hypothetical protein